MDTSSDRCRAHVPLRGRQRACTSVSAAHARQLPERFVVPCPPLHAEMTARVSQPRRHLTAPANTPREVQPRHRAAPEPRATTRPRC
eukprot:scaffold3009_cov108-Isochrysis_galbana.AAC.9